MEGNNFNCKEADHLNEQYESICTNPDCQEQSKFFCGECAISNKHYLAELNQGFIKRIKKILISKAPHLDFWKPIDKRIIEFYQQSVQQDVQQNNNDNNEEIKIMENSLNQMRNEINKKIDQMIKNLNIVLSKNNDNNNQIKLIEERIVKNYDLLPLITAFNQLKNGEITDNQANEQLKQFFSNHNQNRLTEGKQIILDSQFKSYKFEEQIFKNDLQPKILKQISELEPCLIDQRLKNYKYQIDLDFFSSKKNSNNSSSLQFEKETGIINIPQTSYGSRFEIYSSPFSRYKKVNFSFKILEYQKNISSFGLVFGIHAVKNDQNYSSIWGQNGNQIDLTQADSTYKSWVNLSSFGKFEVNGQLPSQIFSQGMEFYVQACVKENLLIISDKENKSKITNQKMFEDDTNWVFVFNCPDDNKNLKIQIMKYEIN